MWKSNRRKVLGGRVLIICMTGVKSAPFNNVCCIFPCEMFWSLCPLRLWIYFGICFFGDATVDGLAEGHCGWTRHWSNRHVSWGFRFATCSLESPIDGSTKRRENGQCGCRLIFFYCMFCRKERINVYFNEATGGRYVPRAVLMDLEPGRGPLQTVGTWIIPLKFLSGLGSRTEHLAPRTFCHASVSIDGDMRISFFMVPYFLMIIVTRCFSLTNHVWIKTDRLKVYAIQI